MSTVVLPSTKERRKQIINEVSQELTVKTESKIQGLSNLVISSDQASIPHSPSDSLVETDYVQ